MTCKSCISLFNIHLIPGKSHTNPHILLRRRVTRLEGVVVAHGKYTTQAPIQRDRHPNFGKDTELGLGPLNAIQPHIETAFVDGDARAAAEV